MQELQANLQKHTNVFFPVVAIGESDKVASLNLSASTKDFTTEIFNDIKLFSAWIDEQRIKENASYLIGGYNENRAMYRRSTLFDASRDLDDEPRSLHLGMDIWADAGTKIYAPMDSIVHSFAFNNQHGDYGATIILQHQLEDNIFYTLYGHLSLEDIQLLKNGQPITRGDEIARFGSPEENGNWPPHLHFQVIADIGTNQGDYPGVCKLSEAGSYLQNCPDPELIFHPFG